MVIEVHRGQPTPEEIAAITAVLLARAAGAQREARPRFAHGHRHVPVRWQRFERRLGYRSPVSWIR